MSYTLSRRWLVQKPALCICASAAVSHRCTRSCTRTCRGLFFCWNPWGGLVQTLRRALSVVPTSAQVISTRGCECISVGWAVPKELFRLLLTFLYRPMDEWISEKMKNMYIFFFSKSYTNQTKTQKKLACQNLIGKGISQKYIWPLYSATFLYT